MQLHHIDDDAVLNGAFAWLCQRGRYSANADIWSFHRNWLAEKTRIQTEREANNYRFDVLNIVQ